MVSSIRFSRWPVCLRYVRCVFSSTCLSFCLWTSLSPISVASSWCYAHELFPYSSPRDPRYVMGALSIHFKHFQLCILSLYKQSRYFLHHYHDALRLFISSCAALHEHQSRMAVTSSISPAPVAGAPVSLETKLRMTMSFVVLTFLVCRTPFFVFLVITTKDLDHPPDFLGQLSFWAIYLHSACDPFIYAFKHPEYQDTLKDIARKFKIAITSTFCCCMSKDANEEETKEKR